MAHYLAVVFVALCAVGFTLVRSQVVPDNRCFLENGGSSESFFVSEDLEIGSVIGHVRVHGDPRPGGTIALHLKESDSPIDISPGSKNLTLIRQLDKEGIDGPSSVFINLICERLRTLDTGFVIPVNIRVTDANDNAPEFINAPYVLNISEVTVVGTRVLQGVHAIDADQQGPFSSVKYSVLPGPNSNYFEFENELEGTLVLKKPLDYEKLRSFDVNIRAQDHGEPPKSTDTVLTVHVVDADDQNPKFLDDNYTSTIPDLPIRGANLVLKPREIKAYDQDLGINAPVYYSFNGNNSYFKINRITGRVSIGKDLTENDLMHPATLVIKATQQDNPDRYALSTLTVYKKFQSSLKFLKHVFYVRASEALPPGAVLTMLSNNRPGEHLRYFVSEQGLLKVFSINTRGELGLRKKLDFEERNEYVFKVFATDGITNDSAVVNVSVEDVNEWEPRFRYPHYEFFVSGQENEIVGKIEAADGDKSDRIVLTLAGLNASLFAISPFGELKLIKGGKFEGIATLAVIATDNGEPQRTSSVPVTVHFPVAGKTGAVVNSAKSNGGPLILAGLGGILLVLAFVIALLIAYICKAKRNRNREELPSLEPEKSVSTSPPMVEKISNPMFAGVRSQLNVSRSPTATAMGGVPTVEGLASIKARIPSPKVHPAPQPPNWPQSASSQRTDSDSTDNLNNIDSSPKVTENSNLTVYF
ncbi:PREDICTED: cadherin-related tumor suppressor-like [Nicrophorus vespilloides]|uniref:Cadherin-related tumor suppressor-like n=1 Tax=Nicrophorus vespilloides TaxID=110193 RepID=A0ABM1M524_NICVS|nr:PREDICTED: cadherin-related tumor suppressor-like [Nicrophorus vespilloides]